MHGHMNYTIVSAVGNAHKRNNKVRLSRAKLFALSNNITVEHIYTIIAPTVIRIRDINVN